MKKKPRYFWRVSWIGSGVNSGHYHFSEDHPSRLSALIRRWSLSKAKGVSEIQVKKYVIN